ncbi:MAG: hypothetical protein ACRCT0_15160, partial [Plesiomonas shigelloides]
NPLLINSVAATKYRHAVMNYILFSAANENKSYLFVTFRHNVVFLGFAKLFCMTFNELSKMYA